MIDPAVDRFWKQLGKSVAELCDKKAKEAGVSQIKKIPYRFNTRYDSYMVQYEDLK